MAWQDNNEATEGNDAVPLMRGGRNLSEVRIRLESWLASRMPALGKLAISRLEHPAAGGVANETLLLETTCNGRSGPGLVVRPEGEQWLYPGITLDLHREMYEGVRAAGTVPVPAVLAMEHDPALLGCRFMLMERVAGRAAPDRPNFNRAGWLHDLPAAGREAVWQSAVGTMASLHRLETWRFPLLATMSDGKSGIEAALDYWTRYAKWCHASENHLVAAALDWLRMRLPPSASTSLSWGDARLQNLMFSETRCTALLDWDLVSLAGAEADLAWWALADHKYTASAGRPRLTGIGSPAQTIRLWESLAGRKVCHMEWHLVFASLRQALISIRLEQVQPVRRESGIIEPSIGLQWLSCLLSVPLEHPMTLPFVGLEH